MQPLMVKLATAFKDWQPAVKTAVQGGGSEAALRQFKDNQATIRRGDAKNLLATWYRAMSLCSLPHVP